MNVTKPPTNCFTAPVDTTANSMGATAGLSGSAVTISDGVSQARPPVTTFLTRLPATTLIALARLYQRTLSPLLGPTCRFYPSCSEYFIHSVRRYGVLRGTARGLLRVSRCHPFHPGGYDPP